MPEEGDWVLFGPLNDKSLMRDVLAYKLGRDLGRYAPRTRYCELVLNNQYQGIYVLIEKIKRDKNRVDIARLDPDEISGDDLTGGYIIKIDKSSGNSGPGWNSTFAPPGRSGNQVINFQYEYPKHDAITAAQKEYIKNFVAQFEEALAGKNFRDPVMGYAKYADVDSFVDFFIINDIINEISKNVDGYRLSTFMHKQKKSDGDKLVMGPIWDFNLGFGNADYCTRGDVTGFVTEFNSLCHDDYWLIPFWWDRLMLDNSFRTKLALRWEALRQDKFKTSTLHAYIDSVTMVLNAESQQRNFERWPVLNHYIWPNYYVGPTFQSEVVWLKNWISSRTAWLDQKLAWVVTGSEDPVQGVTTFNFPNPFEDGGTVFHYILDRPADIQVVIRDMTGKVVEEVSVSHRQPGNFEVTMGRILSPGLYYHTLNVDGIPAKTGKLVRR
jgi:hypothetical protein